MIGRGNNHEPQLESRAKRMDKWTRDNGKKLLATAALGGVLAAGYANREAIGEAFAEIPKADREAFAQVIEPVAVEEASQIGEAIQRETDRRQMRGQNESAPLVSTRVDQDSQKAVSAYTRRGKDGSYELYITTGLDANGQPDYANVKRVTARESGGSGDASWFTEYGLFAPGEPSSPTGDTASYWVASETGAYVVTKGGRVDRNTSVGTFESNVLETYDNRTIDERIKGTNDATAGFQEVVDKALG